VYCERLALIEGVLVVVCPMSWDISSLFPFVFGFFSVGAFLQLGCGAGGSVWRPLALLAFGCRMVSYW